MIVDELTTWFESRQSIVCAREKAISRHLKGTPSSRETLLWPLVSNLFVEDRVGPGGRDVSEDEGEAGKFLMFRRFTVFVRCGLRHQRK